MKKRIAALALAFAALIPTAVCVSAEEEYLPTVYIADSVWYKDKSQPMIMDGKDGFCISIDAFGALPSVTVDYDSTVNAIRLTCGEKAFSADAATGTVISALGDTTLRILNEYGTVYLNVEDVCGYLGLDYEPHFYSNGKRAVRINDGSGTLDTGILVRMFVNQKETLSRMEGEPISDVCTEIIKANDAETLDAAAARLEKGDRSFILAINAELILSYGSTSRLCALMGKIFSSGIPVSLYAQMENADTALHYVHSANVRLLELMHRGITLFTPTTELIENDIALIEQRGLIITDFTFKEVK